jgi:hypothetical protein
LTSLTGFGFPFLRDVVIELFFVTARGIPSWLG